MTTKVELVALRRVCRSRAGRPSPETPASRAVCRSATNATLSDLRWRKAFAIFAREDFLVGLIVVAEAEVRAIPAEFLAGEACRLYGQQRRLSDAPTDGQWRPER